MSAEVQEEIRKLRSWIVPKELVIHSIKQEIETQELVIKQNNENFKSGFLLKQADKSILEQITKFAIEGKKLEKERLIRDLNSSYYIKLQDLELRQLQDNLKIEENILTGTKDKITKLSRNHKVEKSQDKEAEEVKATADFIEKEITEDDIEPSEDQE